MTYLMDDLMGAAQAVRRSGSNHPLTQGYKVIAEKLAGVPRFLLDEAAARTTVEIGLGRPRVLVDALKTLRETYSSIELPIIMVTAKDQSDDVVKALDLGATVRVIGNGIPHRTPAAKQRDRESRCRNHDTKCLQPG